MCGCPADESSGSGREWSEMKRRELAEGLRRASFAEDEVAAWLAAPPSGTVAQQIAVAQQWRSAGFPGGEAVQWDEVAFDPSDALSWAAAGFTPLQAEYAQAQILRRHGDGNVDKMLRDEADWRASGIPPLWICRLLGARVCTLAEALDLYERSRTDSTIAGRLRLLAGLDGWDFSYLESETA